MVVLTAFPRDMANTPGIVEARWCVLGRRRLASVAAPLGFIKKRARIRVHSSKGNLASIFRPIDDLEESDHIDSGQVFDRSAEGSPNPSAEQRHGIGRAVDEFT